MKIKHIIITAVVTGISICALPLYAANQSTKPKAYQVDLIIFSKIDKQTLNSEAWPFTNKSRNMNNDNTLQLIASTTKPYVYNSLLPESFSSLARFYQALQRNTAYHVLVNYTWCTDFSSTTPLRIAVMGGNNYSATTTPSQQPENKLDISNSNSNIKNNDHYELSGVFQLIKSRYFIINLNLLLDEPTQLLKSMGYKGNLSNISYKGFHTFQLIQKRRIKSNELNYFDSPLFGAIINISPCSTAVVSQNINSEKSQSTA